LDAEPSLRRDQLVRKCRVLNLRNTAGKHRGKPLRRAVIRDYYRQWIKQHPKLGPRAIPIPPPTTPTPEPQTPEPRLTTKADFLHEKTVDTDTDPVVWVAKFRKFGIPLLELLGVESISLDFDTGVLHLPEWTVPPSVSTRWSSVSLDEEGALNATKRPTKQAKQPEWLVEA
jgi:hypothetical protein